MQGTTSDKEPGRTHAELSGATLPPLPSRLDGETLAGWEATLPPGASLDAVDPGATLKARDATDPEVTRAPSSPGAVPTDVMNITAPPLPPDPAGYDLLDSVGRGGMGVVFRAMQKSLRREVAYKRPHRDEAAAARLFLSEALVTGFLEHPNIVPVHSLGADADGRIFFTMKLVQGTSWGQLLHPPPASAAVRERASAMDTEAHLRILLSVCHAVAFAHSRGIVHRDLKPDNVMIGDFGEVLLMDWGVAVEVGAEVPREARAPHGSRSSLGGTPAYMAPEMAAGRTDLLSPRSDLYLLGAILHEVLTGRAPHSGGNVTEVLQRAAESPPPALEGVPPELAAICRKAMARDPADRHPDVRAFQGALEHYLQHRQSMLITQLAGEEEARLDAESRASGSVRQADGGAPARLRYERHAKLVARYEQALELWGENEAARAGLRRARLSYARCALGRGDLGLAQSQLDHLGQADDPEVQRIREQVVNERRERERRESTARRTRSALRVVGVALFASLALGYIFVRQERNQKMAEAMRADQNAAHAQAEAREAEQGRTREAELRRLSELRLGQSLIHEGDYLGSLFDWEGARSRYLESWSTFEAAGGDPLPARLAIWRHIDRYAVPLWVGRIAEQKIHALAFSPDRRWLAVGYEEGFRIVDVALGRVVITRFSPALCLAWMPDSRYLVVGGTDVMVWDRVEEEPEITFDGSYNLIHRVAVTPDGTKVIAGGMAQSLWVWKVDDVTPIHTLEGHGAPIWVLSVTSDGNTAYSGASVGKSAEIRSWDINLGTEVSSFLWQTQDCSSGAFTPDGKLAFSGARDRILRVLDTEEQRELEALAGHQGVVTCVTSTPDGNRALTGGDDRLLKLWDARHARLLAEFGGHTAEISAVTVSADGGLASSADARGDVFLWGLEDRRPTRQEATAADSWLAWDMNVGVVSPDGKLAASSTSTGTVSLWDVATGSWLGALQPVDPGPGDVVDPPSVTGTAYTSPPAGLVTEAPGPPEWRRGTQLASMFFDPTGRWIHGIRSNGRAEHWDLHEGSHTSMQVSTAVSALTTDGLTVIQWPRGGEIRVVDAFTGQLRGDHTAPAGFPGAIAPGPVSGQAFVATWPPPEPESTGGPSPDETPAPAPPSPATTPPAPRLALWNLAEGRPVVEYQVKDVPHQLLPRPDGTLLVTLSPQGSHLIEVTTGKYRAALPSSSVGIGRWSPDGRWFLLQAEDSAALLVYDPVTGRQVRSIGEDDDLTWYCSPSMGWDLDKVVGFPQSYASSRQFVVWDLEAGYWIRDQWPRTAPHLFPPVTDDASQDGVPALTSEGAAALIRWYAALGQHELAMSVAASTGTSGPMTEVTTSSPAVSPRSHDPIGREPLEIVLARCLFDRGRGRAGDRAHAAGLVRARLARLPEGPEAASERLHLQLFLQALERPRPGDLSGDDQGP